MVYNALKVQEIDF